MLATTTILLSMWLGAGEPPVSPWEESTSTGARAKTAPGPAPTGLDISRGYLAVSPGVMTLWLSSRPIPMYVWGLEGGYHLARNRFKLQAGLQFEHTLFNASHEHSDTRFVAHWLRFAPLLRLGGGSARTIGYGLLSLALDVVPRRPIYFEGPIGGDVVNAHPSLGGGFQRWIRGSVFAGGEAVLDIVSTGGSKSPSERDLFLRLRLFVGVFF